MPEPLVLHVLPSDLPRGAQRYARAMRLALDGRDARHRTLTLFGTEDCALFADVKLATTKTRLGKLGLQPNAVVGLARYIAQNEPDFVVAHGSEPLKYLTAVTPPHTTLVYYKIGVAHSSAHRMPRRLFYTLLLRRPRVVAGVSQECLDEARIAFDVPASKLVLIPNGRDPELFAPRIQATLDVPMLTFVGHLSPTKRPARFIEVVERLRAQGVTFAAQIVGDGPLLETLRPAASRAGVALLGQRNDVPTLLKNSDLFLFTSVPDGEGMPGVFIEAGLCGLPIVSTATPGASTVVRDGVSGFVVPVDDVDAMVAKAARLLLDSQLRAEFGRAARAHCVEGFSLQASVERWHSLIAGL
jgi:glycosyltransferase involved in cell wall biosynthesis